MEQKTYWNKVAGEKTFTIPVSMELLKKYLTPTSRILDFGCGHGRILVELQKNGFLNLSGVDISENMIEIAKTELANVNFKTNLSTDIPYDDSYCDCVIAAAVLTCIPGSHNQKKLVAEIERVLKADGIVYVCDFLVNQDRRNIERYNKYKDKYSDYGVFEIAEGVVLRHHTVEWIDELTSSFVKLLFEKRTFITMNGHTSNGFCFVGKRA